MSTIGHTVLPKELLVVPAYVEITPESEIRLHQTVSGSYRILIDGRVHPCLVGMTGDKAVKMILDFDHLHAWARRHSHV